MPTQLTRAAIDDALTTLQNAAAATANGTALDVKGWAVVAVQVTGSFSATVTFEVTLDGSTWVSAQAVNVATGATATTATAAGDYLIAVAGFEYFRARVTWTSGTSVTVKGRATPFDSSVVNAAAGAETVTANQGTAGSGAWPVKGAGTAGSADTGVLTVQGIASATPVQVALQPQTANGSSIYRNLDVGVTGVRIKSGAGQLYGYYISNNAATARFVKLYDSNTNPPTQADTPVITLQIPASSAANVAFPNGVTFTSGIGIRASTGVADNDTGATTTNDVIVNLLYK